VATARTAGLTCAGQCPRCRKSHGPSPDRSVVVGKRRVSDLGGRVLHPPLDLKSRRHGLCARHALVSIAGPPRG
jgi:hypothetical protein